VLIALATLVACSRGDADARALEQIVRAYLTGMASESPEENRAAMARLVPTADDFEALVPGKRDALWAVWGPEAEKLVANAPERAGEIREVMPVVAVRSVDLRKDAPVVLAKSLSYLPPDLPVRGVAIQLQKGERAASAFVRLGGRWIWIWDLDRLGSIIVHASS
jgi:hypothetical protein